MRYFPFFFDLRDKLILIVGGGDIAFRKAELLLRAGARLRLVAPQVEARLTRLVEAHEGQVIVRPYQIDDLQGCYVVVAATDNEVLNKQVSEQARQLRLPINVVDCPALSDFIFPAIVDRSPLVVAISSSGASPVLARRLRTKIETLLPTAMGNLASFCDRLRRVVKSALPMAQRRIFWEEVLDGAVAESVLSGDETTAECLFHQQLQQAVDGEQPSGEVYLIGAGPGDADLLTLKALRLLQQADVVVYDRLVSDSVLDLARRDAEKIYVGKQRDCHLATQEQINTLLITQAKRGLRVARLKGGDPFIFGRGGEEQAALQAAGIAVQVVAGITAASGCAAAAGIPLTHRHIARGLRFCTAYRQDLNDSQYWQQLAADRDSTLVFYMAGATLSAVANSLIIAGRSAQTPAAVICAGATAAQRVIVGDLQNIADRAKEQIFSPTLIIVGEVVRYHQPLETADSKAQNSPFETTALADILLCGKSKAHGMREFIRINDRLSTVSTPPQSERFVNAMVSLP